MNIPLLYFDKFRNTRAVLDCTEIPIQKNKCLNCKICSYSHYKGTNTVKFLIAVSPAGIITYISKGFTVKATDKYIFNEEHLIDLFERNDAIMTDKGFLIENELEAKGIVLHRPIFKKHNQQFTKEESQFNAVLSAARVHVERVIQRMKIYKILRSPVSTGLFCAINEITYIIGCMVNLSEPILNETLF